MKLIEVRFKIRYLLEEKVKVLIHKVEVESDSTDKELDQQITEYYWKEIVQPEDKKIAQTYPYEII